MISLYLHSNNGNERVYLIVYDGKVWPKKKDRRMEWQVAADFGR